MRLVFPPLPPSLLVPDGAIEGDRVAYAFEGNGPDPLEAHAGRCAARNRRLTHEDLPRRRLGRDARADMRLRKAVRSDLLDEVKGAEHRVLRLWEKEMDPVAEHLHDLALPAIGHLLDELRELQRHASRGPVPDLFGRLRVAGEIREDYGLRMRHGRTLKSRALQRGFDVVPSMTDRVPLEVAPVEPGRELVNVGNDPNADLRQRRLEDLPSESP